MHTWLHFPQNLQTVVEAYWFLAVNHTDTLEQCPVLLPDAHPHYIIAPEKQHYSYSHSNGAFQGSGSHLLGVSSQTLTLEDTPPIIRIGIKFKPGACYALFSQEGAEILNTCNTHPTLATLLPYKSFAPLLRCTDSREAIISLLDTQLEPLAHKAAIDRHYSLTSKAVTVMDDAIKKNEWDSLNTQAIADSISCSKRTLERSFLKATGTTVKQYQTMEKLNALFVHLYGQKNIHWAEVAEHFCFSDQAHLIRKLKSLLNQTPRQYLKNKNMIVDIYGTFE